MTLKKTVTSKMMYVRTKKKKRNDSIIQIFLNSSNSIFNNKNY